VVLFANAHSAASSEGHESSPATDLGPGAAPSTCRRCRGGPS